MDEADGDPELAYPGTMPVMAASKVVLFVKSTTIISLIGTVMI